MKRFKRFLVPAIIFVAGTAMVITGIRNGELDEIMQKAITICLECIGFG